MTLCDTVTANQIRMNALGGGVGPSVLSFGPLPTTSGGTSDGAAVAGPSAGDEENKIGDCCTMADISSPCDAADKMSVLDTGASPAATNKRSR
jgi:hypothetical protein